jgi:transcriptional regulator with XRE-family HTH domain
MKMMINEHLIPTQPHRYRRKRDNRRDESEKMVLGLNIKKFRERLGLSQEQLAGMLGVGQPTISFWEQGRTKPNLRQLLDLANLFGTIVDALLGRESPEETTPVHQLIGAHIAKELLKETSFVFLDESQFSIAIAEALLEKGQGAPQVLSNNLGLYSLWRAHKGSLPQLEFTGGSFFKFEHSDALFPLPKQLGKDVDAVVMEVTALVFRIERDQGLYLDEVKAPYKKQLFYWPTRHRIMICPPEGINRVREGCEKMSLETLLENTPACTILTARPQEENGYLYSQLKDFEDFEDFAINITRKEGKNLKLIVFDEKLQDYTVYGSPVYQAERAVKEAGEQGDNLLLVKGLVQLAGELMKLNRRGEARQHAEKALELAKTEKARLPGEVWAELGDIFFGLDPKPLARSIYCYRNALADPHMSQELKANIQTKLIKAEAYTDL